MKPYINAYLGRPMYCIIDDCFNHPENYDTGLCSVHNREERKRIENEKKGKKKVKPIAKVSDKRKVLNTVYATLREQYLKDHPECEIKLQVCTRTSTQIHHKSSGWNKATNLNNTATWLASCDMCNQFLHDKLSAAEARYKGLKI